MNMNDISTFIQDNSEYINQGMFKELYDEAYDWLTDEQTAELTKMLTKALNIPAEDYARENLMKHFLLELQNFKVDKKHKELGLPTFIRMYMNHTQGIDYVDFVDMVTFELESNPVKDIQIDLDSDLDVILRKKGR